MKNLFIFPAFKLLFENKSRALSFSLKKLSSILIFMFVLTGCSQTIETFNPDLVEMSLTIIPNEVRVEEQAELIINVEGMSTNDSYEVAISYVEDGKNTYQYLEGEGHTFTGSLAFPESGAHIVYLHLFGNEIHLMKKHVVEVK